MKISEGRSSAQRSGQRQGSAQKKAGILNPSSPGGKPSGRKALDTGSNALPPACADSRRRQPQTEARGQLLFSVELRGRR